MRPRPAVSALAGLCLGIPLSAQAPNYTGTYTASYGPGGVATLVLRQAVGGAVSGSLSAEGVTFAINGVLEDGGVLGTMTGAGMAMYIAAEFDQGRLMVTLFESGANNQPNYESGETIAFVPQGGAAVAAGPPAPKPPAEMQPAHKPPLAPPAQPAQQPTQPMGPPPPMGGGNPLTAWNMAFTVPSGWQVSRTLGRLQVLASHTAAGAIFAAPGLYRDFNEVAVDVSQFFQSMNLQAMPIEQPRNTTVAGMRAMTATYASYDQMGQVVHSHGIAMLSPHGTGFVVFGMTTPQQMPQLRRTVEQLATSVRVSGPPQVNQQLVQALAGRWMFYEGRSNPSTRASGGANRSHEEYVQFDGRGQFSWQSSSSVSVTTPGYTGSAGGAQANNDAGTYTVIGTTLVLKGRQGQLSFEIQLQGNRLVADGRTYLRAN